MEALEESRPRLERISEAQASEKPFADKWSIKEILGHLIDSASTNHQRFVRMQESSDSGVIIYEQEHWVRTQRYREEPWMNIVELWYSYNRHLAHVIDHVDPAALDHVCDIGYGEPATLRFVLEDYVRHLRHHLDQIFSGDDPRQRKRWE